MNELATTPRKQIEKTFNELVAQKAAVLTRPQAEMAASRQILRDIQAGTIDEAEGLEFLIEQEMKYGHAREVAETHFRNIMEGRTSDWPPRASGFQQIGNKQVG